MSARIRLGGDAMVIRYPKPKEGDRMGILSGNYHTRCGKSHRTIRAVAKCCWPGARVGGDGPYAAVSADCTGSAVLLFETEQAVREWLAGEHERAVLYLLGLADDGLYRNPAHP